MRNPKLCVLLGYSETELWSINFAMLVYPEGRVNDPAKIGLDGLDGRPSLRREYVGRPLSASAALQMRDEVETIPTVAMALGFDKLKRTLTTHPVLTRSFSFLIWRAASTHV